MYSTTNEVIALQIIAGIFGLGFMCMWVAFQLEYNRRKKAEQYIYIDKDDVTEYEKFRKWF